MSYQLLGLRSNPEKLRQKTTERYDQSKARHRTFLKDMVFGRIIKKQPAKRINYEMEAMVLKEVDIFLKTE
jgi:hypothetical protein